MRPARGRRIVAPEGGAIGALDEQQLGSSPDPGAELQNLLVWGNLPTTSQIDAEPEATYPSSLDTSLVELGCPSSPLVLCSALLPSADPLFTDATAGVLTLGPSSPARDAGDTAALPPDVFDLDGDGDTTEPIPIDRAGQPRVVGGTVDLGAYEIGEGN
ncbi:MAG: choice-of-anchor Q domain-containing protein [Polyangiaceae bacterium]